MAYLSNQDEEEQQSRQQGGGFNQFATASAVAGGQNSAGDDSASNTAQKNASDYTQSVGTDSSTGSGPPQAQRRISGLGSNTPGGGFTNFSAYENANPSSANQISEAGNKLVGSETSAFTDATKNNSPNSGFSTDISGAPGQDNPFINGGGILGRIGGGTGKIHEGGPYQTVSDLLTSGDWDTNKQKLSGWMGETYNAPSFGYTPSQEWQTSSPELSQQGMFSGSGSNNPSVIDYLAKQNINAGNYSLGERSLDQALIAGDPNAQTAIKGNADKFGGFTNMVGGKQADFSGQTAQDAALAPKIAAATTSQITGLQGKTKNDIQSQVDAFNQAEESKKMDLYRAYNAWLNGDVPGYLTQDFKTNITPGVAATTANDATKEQQLLLNRISDLTGGSQEYSGTDPTATAGTYSWDTPTANYDIPRNLISTAGAYGGTSPIETIQNAAMSGTPLSKEQLDATLGKLSETDLRGLYARTQEAQNQMAEGGNQQAAALEGQMSQTISQYLKGEMQTPQQLAASLGLTPEDLKMIMG